VKPHIYISVTNDLVTDQRVDRTAGLLSSAGAVVCLIGRILPGSPDTGIRSYRTKRLRLLVKKGPAFYAAYNTRLFFYLVSRRRISHIVSNDLDTLAACFFASRLRGATLVYDSHEYFTEVPELQGRRFVKSVWTVLEKCIVPRLKFAYTVNDSIARILQTKYGVHFHVVRNVPSLRHESLPYSLPDEARGKKIVIYQGAVNIGRGIEEVIDAVKPLDDVVFVIAGTGDIIAGIRSRIKRDHLEHKVILTGRIKPANLHSLTSQAHLGVSCELNMGLNYFYALPNKLFSYIHAGIPVLTSAFPEMEHIVKTYSVGMTVDDPANTARLTELLKTMLYDEARISAWKSNTLIAARELCWEKEQIKLKNIYSKAGLPF